MKAMMLIISLGLLAACSASVDDGNLPSLPTIPGDKSNDGVGGPDVNGEWMTQCQSSFSRSTQLYLKIDGDNFKRTYETFSDKNCETSEYKQEIEGTFVFLKENGDFWELEYRIPFTTDGGVSGYSIQYENIQLGDGVIYTSELVGGDSAPNLDVALYPLGDPALEKPIDDDPVVVIPECGSYSGRYYEGSQEFIIKQSDCDSLNFSGSYKYVNPYYPSTTTYEMNDQYQNIDGLQIKSKHEKDYFRMEYTLSNGNHIVEEWRITKSPCNVWGSLDHLEMRKITNGVTGSATCNSWYKAE